MSTLSDNISTTSGGHSSAKTRGGSERRVRRLKVVLRRLPHSMTEPDLVEQLEPMPASVSRRWFRAADRELLPFAFSRAYLVFDNEQDAIGFCERFNGYVFVDKLGNESMAIAEQALFPDVPKRRDGCGDRRMNTLDSDAEYQKFLSEYNNVVVKRVTDFDGLLRDIEDRHRAERLVKPTPLTEFVERHASGGGRYADRRVVGRGGNRFRAEKSAGGRALTAPSSSTKKGLADARRLTRNEWASDTIGSGSEPPPSRRRERRKKPVKERMETVADEPPVEQKRILCRNEDRQAVVAAPVNPPPPTNGPPPTESAQSATERRRPPRSRRSNAVAGEPSERREGGGRRGPRFSDCVARHQEQQESSSSTAVAAGGSKSNAKTVGQSSKTTEPSEINEKRRRERRRFPRGDKPPAAGGNVGGIAVVVLRSLKAASAKEAAQPDT